MPTQNNNDAAFLLLKSGARNSKVREQLSSTRGSLADGKKVKRKGVLAAAGVPESKKPSIGARIRSVVNKGILRATGADKVVKGLKSR